MLSDYNNSICLILRFTHREFQSLKLFSRHVPRSLILPSISRPKGGSKLLQNGNALLILTLFFPTRPEDIEERTLSLQQRFTKWFELDLRSLAAFRIFMGICLSVDLFQKLRFAKDLYSDWGVMPRTYWVHEYMSTWKISFLLANGETWFQYAFLAVALIFALAFTVGYRTKLSQIVVLIMLGSIQSRNYLVLSCADDLLRLSLFWSLLLPLDRCFALQPSPSSTNPSLGIRSVGSLLLILQLLIMYLATAVYKINPVWTTEHSAIYYALNIEHFTTPLGQWLKDFEDLGAFLTQTTLIWEFVGPILIFSPFFTRQLRILTAGGFIFFHLGLAFSLNLGTFPWVAISYWFLFIPGEWWERIFSLAGQYLPQRLRNFRFTPSPSRPPLPLWGWRSVEGTFALLMCLVLFQNIADIYKGRITSPAPIRHLLYTLNLNQVWDMFAPYPIKNDGWFILEGHFQNGEVRELLTGGPVSTEKPSYVSNLYPSSEWRKFYLNLWDQGKRRILLPFARYMCRSQVSKEDGSPLSTLKITFMKETTPPRGEPAIPVVPVELWSHDCFAK